MSASRGLSEGAGGDRSSVRSSQRQEKKRTTKREAGTTIIKDKNSEGNKLADKSSIRLSVSSNSEKSSTSKAKSKKKIRAQEAIAPKKKVLRSRPKKRSLIDKLMISMGFYVGNVVLKDPRAIEAAQALNLQPWHLRRLKAKFDKVDLDGSGNIDYDEFFESVGEQRSPFTDKLFALIDLDGSGTIEFDEYVRVLATYCMFTKDEILRFCFECFDVDRSGTIDEKEFVELCKLDFSSSRIPLHLTDVCRCINNASPSFPNNFKKALEEFDVNEDGLIDFGEFSEIDRRYPLVLFPAFRLQDVMQRNSLGEGAWVKVIESYQESRRIEEYKATHGGRAPPESPFKVVMKTILPCLYHEKVHIQVGAEMENRHRHE